MSYWRRAGLWAWERTETYSPKKAVPSIIIAVLTQWQRDRRIWGSDLWQTSAIIVGVYVALLSLEFIGRWLFQAGPALDKNCREEVLQLRASLANAQNRRRVSEKLGSFHEKGEIVHQENQREKADVWVTETHEFIRDTFGAGEAALFLSDAGFTFLSGDGPVRNWVRGRLQRLASLIERSDDILRQREV